MNWKSRHTPRRVLVTGGAGFIGAHLLSYPRDPHPGHRLMALGTLTHAGNLGNIEGLENDPRLRFGRGDILSQSLVVTNMQHTAAVVQRPESGEAFGRSPRKHGHGRRADGRTFESLSDASPMLMEDRNWIASNR